MATAKDSMDILDCLVIAQDFSSDSDEEEEMEWLYIQLSFFSNRDKGPQFTMEECSEEEFTQLFRFGKSGFERLLLGLHVPTEYRCVQKTTATGKEALLILLRRLTGGATL